MHPEKDKHEFGLTHQEQIGPGPAVVIAVIVASTTEAIEAVEAVVNGSIIVAVASEAVTILIGATAEAVVAIVATPNSPLNKVMRG